MYLVSGLFKWTDQTKRCKLSFFVEDDSNPTAEMTSLGFMDEAGADIEVYLQGVFIVPPDWYWKIQTNLVEAPNTYTIGRVYEIEL